MERSRLIETIRMLADRTLEYPFKVWGYGEGIGLEGLLAAAKVTGERAYFEFVHGLIEGWAVGRPRIEFVDHTAPGSVLLHIYEKTKDKRLLEQAYRIAEFYESLPRAVVGAGLHRPDHNVFKNYVYVDCMEVDAPFLCRLARVTGERRFSRLGVDLLMGHARALRDPVTGLYFHLYDAAQDNTNGVFWGRGNGWAMLGLIGTLQELDPDDAAYGEIRYYLEQQVETLAGLQDESGNWHTVLDHPETCLESSLAAFFGYGIERSVERCWVESRYLSAARKAWAALLDCIDESGMVTGVSFATPPGNVENYNNAPTGGLYPWGQGPALLAAVTLLHDSELAHHHTGEQSE